MAEIDCSRSLLDQATGGELLAQRRFIIVMLNTVGRRFAEFEGDMREGGGGDAAL